MSNSTTTSHSLGGGLLSRVAYRHLAGVTLAGTYVLMLLGAYTSAIGAGLSCPDWPMCYGTAIPFLHPEIMAQAPWTPLQIFAEWAHRLVAAVMGVFILGTAVAAWKVYGDDKLVKWSATAAVVLLPLQVSLGRFTVTERLEPFIVTSHLGIAILILLCLNTTTLAAWLRSRSRTAA